MKIKSIYIKNFKSIKELSINQVDNTLILVGKNNTGKSVALDAVLAVSGDYIVKPNDFLFEGKNIIIGMKLEYTTDDLELFNKKGIVSQYKKYEAWEEDFKSKLPSFSDGIISFECIISRDGTIKYSDGYKKNNEYIRGIIPKTYFIDDNRDLSVIHNDILMFQGNDSLTDLRENICMFDSGKKCNKCFQCIGMINKKMPEDLSVYETTRLMEYKLFDMNISVFSDKLNRYFHANGSASYDVKFVMDFDVDKIFKVDTLIYNKDRETIGSIDTLSAGLRSIYILSLLEAYIDEENIIPSIIMIEDPENYLHPQLQKVASEILFRLSKKNQVIFSTHSPNMIFNFSSKQIKQVYLDKDYYTVVNEDTDIDEILDDLGYTANDLMNVSFVFIVEGKQDSNRLPMLLEKYYSEIYDESGKLQRVSIIPTNSCTNIKTYANLKYINKLYLKDQFLMIRDSDGKDPNILTRQLCSYYKERAREDRDNLPQVTKKNVLILKYYSFENYFLDPKVMKKIGVIKNEEDFYNILYFKYRDYLYKLGSMRRLIKNTGIRIYNKNDIKTHIELIKTYVRGHNLFDIFYSKYKREAETEILRRYIDEAPKECFDDILKAIDAFVYFENRRKDIDT